MSRITRTRLRPYVVGPAMTVLLAACSGGGGAEGEAAARPPDTPALHHAGLNSVDPEGAIDWYLRVWPDARSGTFADRPAVVADMTLTFQGVSSPPDGAFDERLGRPEAQSPLWHIGAFVNTTDMRDALAAVGVRHVPLYVGPDDTVGVWRSGLAPYAGIATAEALATVEAAEPRPGGFSYVVGPDGALFEFTGGPNTTPSLSHVHLFHEQPQCAANWYVQMLGMALPPVRAEDGSTSERAPFEPCEAELGDAGWPSLERVGTLRQPRATVVHDNGSFSIYPRQCAGDRCGAPHPLVPSRGQVLDHIGLVVDDLDEWWRWLASRQVVVLEARSDFEGGRAFTIEGPDGLALELVELTEG